MLGPRRQTVTRAGGTVRFRGRPTKSQVSFREYRAQVHATSTFLGFSRPSNVDRPNLPFGAVFHHDPEGCHLVAELIGFGKVFVPTCFGAFTHLRFDLR